jgi:catechol 2,3-dioxygenase-like lactoylglutathione lyase family enzyme
MTRALLLAAWLIPAGASAQAPADTAPPFRAVAGSLIALSVADLDASTKWYQRMFGLSVTMNIPRQQGRNGLTVLAGNGLLVELQEHAGAAIPDRAPDARQGIFKVGVVVADFDAALASLRARGANVVIGPFAKRADQPANVIIRDNSGTYIQLFGR